MKKIIFAGAVILLSVIIRANAQQPVSAKEKEDILFMWQEEKLARDVYDSMYRKYDMNPFGNIRQSERRHMAEMENLRRAFGLPSITDKETQEGFFSNTALQELYNNCVKLGSASEEEALSAGALIEETDIRDLKERIKNTSNKKILEAYNYLMMGSENHLRAFCRRLRAAGIVYKPAVLDKISFDAILDDQ